MTERTLLERLDTAIRDPQAQDDERAEHCAEIFLAWLRRRGLRIAADEVERELGGRPTRADPLALETGRG